MYIIIIIYIKLSESLVLWTQAQDEGGDTDTGLGGFAWVASGKMVATEATALCTNASIS